MRTCISVVNGTYVIWRICAPGFETDGLSSVVWPGGETEALTRLERHLERKVKILIRSRIIQLWVSGPNGPLIKCFVSGVGC